MDKLLIAVLLCACVAFTEEKEGREAVASPPASVEITHKAEVYLDALQNLSGTDRTGSAYVREAELELDFVIPKAAKIHIVGLAEYDMSTPFLDEASLSFDIIKEKLQCTGGYFYMPFGVLNSSMISDLLIKGSVETPGPGIQLAGTVSNFSYGVSAYNSALTQRLEASVIQMGYELAEKAKGAVSLRAEPAKNIDLDIEAEITPLSMLSITGECYLGIAQPDSVDKPMGFFVELGVTPLEPVTALARYEQTSDGADSKTGYSKISLGAFYALKKAVTVGAEFGMDKPTVAGVDEDWQNTLGLRLSVAME